MFRPLLRTLPSLSGNVKLVCDVNINKEDNKDNKDFAGSVKSACLLPISTGVFKKYIPVNLLSSTYDYDLKQFYNIYSDIFYKSQYRFNKSEIEILDKANPVNERDKDFEYGCNRSNYKYGQYQYEFFAPVYIDNINDLPDVFRIQCILEFENYKIEKNIDIKISDKNLYESTNYLYNYLYKYISSIDNKVIKLDYDESTRVTTSIYWGIDVLHGGQASSEDIQVSELFNSQCTLQNFDNVINGGFKRNNLVMRQVIPFCFRFNLADVMSEQELATVELCWLDISGKWIKNSTDYIESSSFSSDLWDFDINYDELYNKINIYDEYNCNIKKEYNKEYNIMDRSFPGLNDTNFIKYQFVNRISPNINRWMLSISDDNDPYIINNSQLYSLSQNSSYKYHNFPKQTKFTNSLSVICNLSKLNNKNEVYNPDQLSRYNVEITANNIYNFILPSKESYIDRDIVDKSYTETKKVNDNIKTSKYAIYYNDNRLFDFNNYRNFIMNHISSCCNILYLSSDIVNNIYNNTKFNTILDITTDYINNLINSNKNSLTLSSDSDINIFDTSSNIYNKIWKTPINNYVYYNDIMYNLNKLYNNQDTETNQDNANKITKFGVFLLPVTKVISHTDISKYVSCDFIMQFLPDSINNIQNANSNITESKLSVDYITNNSIDDNNINYYNIDNTINNKNINTKVIPYTGLLSSYTGSDKCQYTFSYVIDEYSYNLSYNKKNDVFNYKNLYIKAEDFKSIGILPNENKYIDKNTVISYINSLKQLTIDYISENNPWANYAYFDIVCNGIVDTYKIKINELLDCIKDIYDYDTNLDPEIKSILDKTSGFNGFNEYYNYIINNDNLWNWCQNIIDNYNNNVIINRPSGTVLDVSDNMLSNINTVNNTYCLINTFDIFKTDNITEYKSYIINNSSLYGHKINTVDDNKYYNIINNYNVDLYNNDGVNHCSYNNPLFNYTLYNKKTSLITYSDICNVWEDNNISGIDRSNSLDIYKYAFKNNLYKFNDDSIYWNNVKTLMDGIKNLLHTDTGIEIEIEEQEQNSVMTENTETGSTKETLTLFGWLYIYKDKFTELINSATKNHEVNINHPIIVNTTPEGLINGESPDDNNNYIEWYKKIIKYIFRKDKQAQNNITPTNIISYINDKDIFNSIYKFNPYLYYNTSLINNNIFTEITSNLNSNPLCDYIDNTDRYIWTDIYNINKICQETLIKPGNNTLNVKEFYCDFISTYHITKYLIDICRDANNEYIAGKTISRPEWYARPCSYNKIFNKDKNTGNTDKGPFDFLYITNKVFIIDDINNNNHIVRYKYTGFYDYIYNKLTDYIYNKYKDKYTDTEKWSISIVSNMVNNLLGKYYISNINNSIVETNNDSYFNITIDINIDFNYNNKEEKIVDILELKNVHLVYKKEFIKVSKYLLNKYTDLINEDGNISTQNNDKILVDFYFSYQMTDTDFDEENNGVDNYYDIELLSNIKTKGIDKLNYTLYKAPTLLKPLYDNIYNQTKESTVIYNNLRLSNISATSVSDDIYGKLVYYRYNCATTPMMVKVNKPLLDNLCQYYNGLENFKNLSTLRPYTNLPLYKLYNQQCELLKPVSEPINNSLNKPVFDYLELSKYNIFTYKDNINNEIYGFYLISVPITNTSITFNSVYNIDIDITKTYNSGNIVNTRKKSISMFDAFEDYSLWKNGENGLNKPNYVGINYLNNKLHQIIPFSNINPLKEVFKIPILESPQLLSIKHRYISTSINTDNTDIKESTIIYTLKKSNIKPVYDNINIIKESKLTRYFNYIRPILKNVYELEHNNEFNYIYNTKRKTTKSLLLDTGKYNSIGDSVIYKYNNCDINKYSTIPEYSDSKLGINNELQYKLNIYYNNIIDYWTEPEYKHFNSSKFCLLPEIIEIPIMNQYTYQEVLKLSDNNIIYNKFKDYINNRLNKTFKINHELYRKQNITDEQILFLYNRYDSVITSKWIGLNKEKTEKLYTITYKYTLK